MFAWGRCCSGLTSIIVSEGNKVYDSRNNCNAIINTATNELVFGIKTTVIPDSVTSIGENAFQYCKGLTHIVIPESVTSIGWYSFGKCTGLKSVVILAKLKKIDGIAFCECTSLETVTLPAGINKIDKRAFEDCPALKTINVPAKKADYYKKRLPENLHKWIVEQ